MTTVLLVRHAAFTGVGRVLAGRTPGVPLNAAGRSQRDRLAQAFRGSGLAAVYTSPMQRAVETATALADAARCDLRLDDRLTEIDWGTWTGRTVDDLRGDPLFARFNTRRSETRIPGGEIMPDVQTRAVAALEAIRRCHPPGARMAVVSHADVLRAVLCHYLGTPLDHLLRFEVSPASVTLLRITDAHASLHALNVDAASAARVLTAGV